MKFALFLGCNIPARLDQYEISSRMILSELRIELVDIAEFNCCGYPLRNFHFQSFILSAARNIALASRENLNILTLCQCCYGSLKLAAYLMQERTRLCKEINAILKMEGLRYDAGIDVKHLLHVLYYDVGIDVIRKTISRPFQDLNIATHYGCHVLRPSQIVQLDDPFHPKIFDRLVEVTGSTSINWPARLECCGAPLLGANDDLAVDLLKKKLTDAIQSGADYLCSACPYCHLQFDLVQKMAISNAKGNHCLPPILYPQLLGLSMGILGKPLGLEMNQLGINLVDGFLSI